VNSWWREFNAIVSFNPIAVLAMSVFVSSCGTDATIADGGGFGGETITGLVVGVSGKGIADASVRLRPSFSLEPTALRVTKTDSTGFFRIEHPVGDAFRLEVAGKAENVLEQDSVRALIDLDRGQSPGRILAESKLPRLVRLRDPLGNPVSATLQAYGLGRSATTDDLGYASLTGWPLADLWVRATLKTGEERDLFVPATGTGEIEVGQGWLIDDFESSLTRTRLGSLIGGGWWYVASQGTDSLSTRDITLTKDTLDSHLGRNTLRAHFNFTSSPTSYGLVGFHFGPTQADAIDLSGLDSLVFWIKGRGSVRVEFVADTVGGVTSHAYVVTPDTIWTRHVVKASALSPIDAGRNWAVDSKRVRFLQFIVFQAAEFRLDELRYFGKERP
jgi:hypothetical protein